MSQPSNYNAIKTAHAVFGILSWVVFFPLGAVMIRAVRSSNSTWIHGGIQIGTLSMLVINAGTGIWMADTTDQLSEYHPIIGLVLFSLAFIQVFSGLAHHTLFKRKSRRTIISYSHIWLGRILITLGMINGGLGLLLADDANKAEYISYGVITALIWLCWTASWVVWELKRGKETKAPLEKNNTSS